MSEQWPGGYTKCMPNLIAQLRADNEALRAELDAAKAQNALLTSPFPALRKQIDELRAENELLRRNWEETETTAQKKVLCASNDDLFAGRIDALAQRVEALEEGGIQTLAKAWEAIRELQGNQSPAPLTTPHVFFVNCERRETSQHSVSGATLKKSVDSPLEYQLFLEEEGDKPDRPIADSENVDLAERIKHFYAVPPATYACPRDMPLPAMNRKPEVPHVFIPCLTPGHCGSDSCASNTLDGNTCGQPRSAAVHGEPSK